MTLTYREARKRTEALPPHERDAFVRRLILHKREVDRAAGPLSVAGLLITFAGMGLLIVVGSRDELGWPFYALTLAVFVLGGWLQHLASRRKRAYERAHPFEP